MGSGLFATFTNHRQALHMQVLREELTAVDPLTMHEVALRASSLLSQIADPALRRAQAVAMIAQEATNQSYVMAYNDAYLLTSLAAMAALAALLLHMMRDAMANRLARKTQPETETA